MAPICTTRDDRLDPVSQVGSEHADTSSRLLEPPRPKPACDWIRLACATVPSGRKWRYCVAGCACVEAVAETPSATSLFALLCFSPPAVSGATRAASEAMAEILL
jgi:hypothetical protein